MLQGQTLTMYEKVMMFDVKFNAHLLYCVCGRFLPLMKYPLPVFNHCLDAMYEKLKDFTGGLFENYFN